MDFGKVFSGAMPLLLEGLKLTVITSLVSILIGMVIGLLVCLMKMSKNVVLRAIAGVYIWIIRGTPMLVQAFIVFFGVPQVVRMFVSDFKFTALTAGIITLSLNAGAYLAEIYRGGIESIPVGQYEAAEVLGYTKTQTFMRIILPQVIKIIMPSVTNEVITLVKDTSLAFTLAYAEVFSLAKQISASQSSFMPFLIAGVFYFVANYVVEFLMVRIEKSMDYYK